uniref:Putative secreted protein n=1 Tax=Anopheles darlingi TaxID=43151 RepID=A0A2M4DNI4_ANODA
MLSLMALKTKISWAWASIRLARAARLSCVRSGVGSPWTVAEANVFRKVKMPALCWNSFAASLRPSSLSGL